MPERRKRVLQNTKIRAAAFTCCLLFPQKRARTFPGGLSQTPSVISRCLRATRLSATVIFFFTSFPFSVPSIFQFLCRQLTYTACNTSSLVLPVVRTLRFHHFSFEAFSFFRKSLRLLPASAGRHLTRSILIHTQVSASHSGFAGHTPTVTFLSKHSQPFTSHHTFFRCQPAISYPQHSYQFSSQNLARRLAGHYFRYIILT